MISVLVIDDDDKEHRLIDCFLRYHYQEDYEIYSAINLTDGIEILKKQSPQFVFLDNRLAPYGDARETIPKLIEYLHGCLLYVISASTDDDYFDEISQLGVEQVIDKFCLKQYICGGLMDNAA